MAKKKRGRQRGRGRPQRGRPQRGDLAKVHDPGEVRRLQREAKAAQLRYQLARLEAGEDVSLDPVEDDEGGMELALGPEEIVGNLGQIAKAMNGMGVEDETAADENGETIKFQRHAGRVKNIRVRRGRVEEVDFEPEDWPPRNEKF